MSKIANFLLIGILLVAAPALAGSHEAGGAQKARRTGQDEQKSAYRTKRLLSAFLLINALPPKSRALPKNTLSFSDAGRAFSGSVKLKAVQNIYRKYGFNEDVQRSLHRFSGQKYDFQKRLELSGKYVGQVTDILSEKGLPEELAWLPLVESGFQPAAYSPKRAAGLWQFMPRTAKKLGLRIDWWVDERRDPVKSTEAAARYLQYLHRKFGSWPLALAAYNAGEGRVSSALNKISENDFWALSDTEHIEQETKEYVPLYIAAAAIASHPEKFGFRRIRYRKPEKFEEVSVNRPMDFDVIAQLAGVSVSEIKELNPELRRRCTPPDALNYRLKVPEGAKDRFLANMARVRGDELDFARFYTVQRGDTVEKIAKNIGASIQDIIDRNGLGRKAIIMSGKKILLPFETGWNRIIKQLMR